MSQSLPTAIGKYQIIREIARSNDIVYEAFDPVMNRRVAVKQLAVPSGSSDQQKADRLKRFHREARAAGSLTHINVVTTYEVFEEGGMNCIAMEYLDGRNLRQELDAVGMLEVERAVGIACKVLDGLSFAHENSVIHRDIKPDNIQLLDNGRVKITDFGIARLAFEPNITIDGQVFGTPSYMSPEQINGKEIDARTDLFSVGVILYEMITGQKPFPGDNVVSITYSIMNKEPEPPKALAYPMLWEVIKEAVSKTPQTRPASAAEMKKKIEAAMSGGAAAASPPVIGTYQQPQAQQQPGQIPQPGPYAPPTPGQTYTQPYVPGGVVYPQPPKPYQPGMQPPAGQGPNTQPYTPPAMVGGLPGQVPVYYPPKRKRKLITVKPETWQLLRKIILITAAFIAAVFLVFQLVEGVSSADLRPASSAPAGEPINTDTLIQSARTSMQQAVTARSESLTGEAWSAADKSWAQAMQSSPQTADEISREAANSYIQQATSHLESGQTSLARKAAYRAVNFSASHPSLRSQADGIISRLGGS
jgi:serine/threonine-protein kinase